MDDLGHSGIEAEEFIDREPRPVRRAERGGERWRHGDVDALCFLRPGPFLELRLAIDIRLRPRSKVDLFEQGLRALEIVLVDRGRGSAPCNAREPRQRRFDIVLRGLGLRHQGVVEHLLLLCAKRRVPIPAHDRVHRLAPSLPRGALIARDGLARRGFVDDPGADPAPCPFARDAVRCRGPAGLAREHAHLGRHDLALNIVMDVGERFVLDRAVGERVAIALVHDALDVLVDRGLPD